VVSRPLRHLSPAFVPAPRPGEGCYLQGVDLRHYLEFATRTAYEAGRLTLGYFGNRTARPEYKEDETPVTQALFTEDEWFAKNQWFADNGSVIYNIDSAESVGTDGEQVVEVTLTLTYGDGTSSTRTTYFVQEDGTWQHRFGQEEYDLFMPELSYEEFVAAQ